MRLSRRLRPSKHFNTFAKAEGFWTAEEKEGKKSQEVGQLTKTIPFLTIKTECNFLGIHCSQLTNPLVPVPAQEYKNLPWFLNTRKTADSTKQAAIS